VPGSPVRTRETSWNFSRGATDDVGGADWHISENADEALFGREAFAGTAPIIADIVHQRIEDNRREVGARQALQRRLEGAIAAWERMPDSVPNGDSICHLIESVGGNRK